MFAIYPDARNPFAHPELLQDEDLADWVVPEVWVMGGPTPNQAVDVSDYFDLKIAALREHASQTAHMDDLAERITQWLTTGAHLGGLPEGRLAESFQVVYV